MSPYFLSWIFVHCDWNWVCGEDRLRDHKSDVRYSFWALSGIDEQHLFSVNPFLKELRESCHIRSSFIHSPYSEYFYLNKRNLYIRGVGWWSGILYKSVTYSRIYVLYGYYPISNNFVNTTFTADGAHFLHSPFLYPHMLGGECVCNAICTDEIPLVLLFTVRRVDLINNT